jgi:hypothetical protein
LATAKKSKARDIVEALNKEGIPASVVGEAVPKKKGIHIFDKDKEYELEHPGVDPFWMKFEEYLNPALSKKFKINPANRLLKNTCKETK